MNKDYHYHYQIVVIKEIVGNIQAMLILIGNK